MTKWVITEVQRAFLLVNWFERDICADTKNVVVSSGNDPSELCLSGCHCITRVLVNKDSSGPQGKVMSSNGTKKSKTTTLQRPKASTVFAAAFLAGAAAAVGVNRALDVHMAQNVPQVESESIFVALRSLPKGSPVTIYDVALRDWPVAMLPATALRSDSSFDGVVLRHPVREGQPILSLQIAKASPEPQHQIAAVTQATQRINQHKEHLLPLIPYNAKPPIPATLASAQKPMAEQAAKDFQTQCRQQNNRAWRNQG